MLIYIWYIFSAFFENGVVLVDDDCSFVLGTFLRIKKVDLYFFFADSPIFLTADNINEAFCLCYTELWHNYMVEQWHYWQRSKTKFCIGQKRKSHAFAIYSFAFLKWPLTSCKTGELKSLVNFQVENTMLKEENDESYNWHLTVMKLFDCLTF